MSSLPTPTKRPAEGSNQPNKKRPTASIIGISRSISLCLRCRNKKIRCLPTFPKCSNCEKAGSECVGVDPSTGREVPRSYVFHLEGKILALEQQLLENGIDPISGAKKQIKEEPREFNTYEIPILPSSQKPVVQEFTDIVEEPVRPAQPAPDTKSSPTNSQSDPPKISFAKLMLTALKMKHNKSKTLSTEATPEVDPTLSHLNADEHILPAILPPKRTAHEFLKIFFAQANSQLPIIHREEFMRNVFVPIYGPLDNGVCLASNYSEINYNFVNGDNASGRDEPWFSRYKTILASKLSRMDTNTKFDTIKESNSIVPPVRFHKALYFLNIVFAISSSVHHLQYLNTISDSFKLAALKYYDAVSTSTDSLEVLQSLLLLSLYSTMRPTNPGVWYTLGTALRLTVDLGLHNESIHGTSSLKLDSFTKDKRRRLFWCVYSLDRQICFYLSRPVGIPEESIDTPFPSELDDALITPHDDANADYLKSSGGMPTYKSISLCFFRIRQIQSEVQKILYENSELPRRYQSLHAWRSHVYRKLKEWKNSIPKTQRKMNCDFNLEFFNLNYNHTLLRLYGLSPKNFKLTLDDFIKVAEASKNLINCYHQLYLDKAINYTWAAVHNLFMAGTSYLFVIYNCDEVRHNNSLFEVKKITQECINVMNSLIDKCDAATSCRDTFEVLTVAVLKLKYNEVVLGLNFNVNSFRSNHHHVNSSLVKLLENLSDHFSNTKNLESKIKEDLESFSEILPNPNDYLVEHQSTHPHHKQIIDHESQISTPVFEWVSENHFNNNEAANQINLYIKTETPTEAPVFVQTNNDLDVFFDELNNLSPISSTSRRNSHSDYSVTEDIVTENSSINPHAGNTVDPKRFSSNSQYDTPYSNESGLSSVTSPIVLTSNPNLKPTVPVNYRNRPSKESKKMYEIMNQMPNEAIWDQFFTNSGNSHAMYANSRTLDPTNLTNASFNPNDEADI